MALFPVTTYSAVWNPANKQGRLLIQVGTGQPQQVPVNNTDEFLIVLMMMGKTGVQYDTASRELTVPFRPVGT